MNYFESDISFSASVESISLIALRQYEKLKRIQVDSDNKNYSSVNGILFNKDKTILICYPRDKDLETYNVPFCVTKIGNNSFYFCHNLISINISENVIMIGRGAFFGCSGLENINIEGKLNSIEDSAFSSCINLKKFILKSHEPPNIASNAFIGCNNDFKIYVPSGSVEAYKNAEVWKEYANNIFGENEKEDK